MTIEDDIRSIAMAIAVGISETAGTPQQLWPKVLDALVGPGRTREQLRLTIKEILSNSAEYQHRAALFREALLEMEFRFTGNDALSLMVELHAALQARGHPLK